MSQTVLIVDDEEDIRKLIAGILSDEGYKTMEAPGRAETLAIFESGKLPEAVLLDIWLEGGTREGLEILAALKEKHADTPVIMMSGHGTLETAVEAIKTGAYDFLEKPFKSDRLLIMLKRALEQSQLKQRLTALESSGSGVGEIVAKSKAMQDLLEQIEAAAPTKSRIFLTGEAGTGKSAIAKHIHERSGRTGKCIIVNAGNFDIAKLAEAEGGTVILEQPEDLPPSAQSDLTRAVQDGQADIRYITTSQADMRGLIAEGKFREDLFYRLNVVPLTMPPLRERRSDIPDLVAGFLPKLAAASGRSAPNLGQAELDWLQAQPWPGNVRELKNTLERFLILGKKLADTHEESHGGENGGWANLIGLNLKDARERFEHDYLQAQLLRHDRNITATADFVGMDRAALHRKLKGLGLTSNDK